jgi:hypothetical protein
VNPDGNLYSYRYQQNEEGQWRPIKNTKLTEQKLEDYYSHGRKFIRKIQPEEWQAKLKLLAEASNGRMSDPQTGIQGGGRSSLAVLSTMRKTVNTGKSNSI